jgi:hypothetical protein
VTKVGQSVNTMYRGPVNQDPFLIKNDTAAPTFGPHLSAQQNDNITTWNEGDWNNGWEDPGVMASQTNEPEPQPGTIQALVQVTGEGPDTKTRGITTLSQVEQLSMDTLSFKEKPKDSRTNWPTEAADFRNKIDLDMLMQDWNQTRRPRKKKSLDEVSSISAKTAVVPQFMTNFIESWIRDAHVVKADFLDQNVDNHEDCDVDTTEGRLMKPILYPSSKTRKFRAS